MIVKIFNQTKAKTLKSSTIFMVDRLTNNLSVGNGKKEWSQLIIVSAKASANVIRQ